MLHWCSCQPSACSYAPLRTAVSIQSLSTRDTYSIGHFAHLLSLNCFREAGRRRCWPGWQCQPDININDLGFIILPSACAAQQAARMTIFVQHAASCPAIRGLSGACGVRPGQPVACSRYLFISICAAKHPRGHCTLDPQCAACMGMRIELVPSGKCYYALWTKYVIQQRAAAGFFGVSVPRSFPVLFI